MQIVEFPFSWIDREIAQLSCQRFAEVLRPGDLRQARMQLKR